MLINNKIMLPELSFKKEFDSLICLVWHLLMRFLDPNSIQYVNYSRINDNIGKFETINKTPTVRSI